MRLAALLLATAALLPLPGRAECGCLWKGSFADVQGQADLVVAGTVTQRKGNSIDIAIARTLRGEGWREQLRVWLQTGDYCRPPAEDFPEGSRWVLALERIDAVPKDGFNAATPNQSYGRKGDYILSSCGGYWLRWTGDAVTGNLVDAPRWAREPEMTPVLLDVLEAYVAGRIDQARLKEASREDPALRELMLNTRQFLLHGDAAEPQ
ncbi:hypothetical protein [Pseudohaliea rubra]|uniref:Delta-aminolevulinic acid dehydratase n=1 Tax=Pseudohaliea rubra DSM 19751 TaxID=1265313 RepID=A0A095VSY7_9GAMM|nr:hypothetical protein [Pseudohaliea rubra]KGE04562.1 conserved hypothetical protein, secreted [Pseudohaliea rubra DSM 19751]